MPPGIVPREFKHNLDLSHLLVKAARLTNLPIYCRMAGMRKSIAAGDRRRLADSSATDRHEA